VPGHDVYRSSGGNGKTLQEALQLRKRSRSLEGDSGVEQHKDGEQQEQNTPGSLSVRRQHPHASADAGQQTDGSAHTSESGGDATNRGPSKTWFHDPPPVLSLT
jgi:hypothetical protein